MMINALDDLTIDFISSLISLGCENPKPCQTELTVLEYGLYDGDSVTKVLLQPVTGNVPHLLRAMCLPILFVGIKMKTTAYVHI